MSVDAADFITSNTRLLSPALVPEITLWLADELTPLWQATESWLEQQNCAPPYWAFAWPGGQVLARYALDHLDLLSGRRVFDLAAGCGIASIAARQAGAKTVTANEIDSLAAAAIKLNAAVNNVVVDVALGDMTDDPLSDIDLVMAGDICYERAMTDRLLQWLQRLAAKGKEVWLADPGRTYLPKHGMQQLATYQVAVTQDLESADHRQTVLYRLNP